MSAPEHDGVWPENVEALTAYYQVHTQWRVVGIADGSCHAVGLDYTGVKAGLKLAGTKVTPELWRDLQQIEIGARDAKNGVKE